MKSGRNRKERPWHKGWIGLLILGWTILLSASCTQPITDGLFRKQIIQASGQKSVAQARLQRGLGHLERGEYTTARQILKKLSQEEAAPKVAQAAAFYLGVVKLLEMDDLPRMEQCRAYFQGYSKKYHAGPYKENVARILGFVDKQIELTRRVQDQARRIQTLKYQIQKLEEIQVETERKRQYLELD